MKTKTFETTKEMVLSCVDANGKINFHLLAFKLGSNEKIVLLKKLLSMFGMDITFDAEKEELTLIELPNKQNLVRSLEEILCEREIFQKKREIMKFGKVKDVNL
jgi:hypothetical protein